ncbi:MAG: hypothetical protein HQL18_02915 [Candidatus Omnitrophica bacterium]|nr:hypothetical protein [Candidatus Omnitrophota bacterium]
MDKRCFQTLGQRFYEWHRGGKIKFEYGGGSKDLELEVERLIGLINYVEDKKKTLASKS